MTDTTSEPSPEELKSVEAIKHAIKITSHDTMSRIRMNERVIWTATGSWNGSRQVTIGDLVNVMKLLDKQSGITPVK